MPIQWFPGHMAKSTRLLTEKLGQLDIIIEVLDARAPRSTHNKWLDEKLSSKPRLLLLNKSDLADPRRTKEWITFFSQAGYWALETHIDSRFSGARLIKHIKQLLETTSSRRSYSVIHAAVIGVPNTGKSSLINALLGKRQAKVGDRPAVTQRLSWLTVDSHFRLLDTPGILWPQFETEDIAMHLAIVNAIKSERYAIDDIVYYLMGRLLKEAPHLLQDRLGITADTTDVGAAFDQLCQHRGYKMAGGHLNLDRSYATFLQEFRLGKLGRFTLDNNQEPSTVADGS